MEQCRVRLAVSNYLMVVRLTIGNSKPSAQWSREAKQAKASKVQRIAKRPFQSPSGIQPFSVILKHQRPRNHQTPKCKSVPLLLMGACGADLQVEERTFSSKQITHMPCWKARLTTRSFIPARAKGDSQEVSYKTRFCFYVSSSSMSVHNHSRQGRGIACTTF